MQNISKVQFDEICIYLNSEVRIPTYAKIILIIINLFLWTGFIFIASSINANQVKSFFIPSVLIIVFLVFVGRFTTWNLWGEEFVIINTKALTHYKSFGIVQTNKSVIKIEKTLAFVYNKVKVEDETEFGDLHFFDYDENNNPIQIYETNILMTKEIAEEVISKIKLLYELEFYEKEKIIPYTLN
jgi:hypothetical protein